MSKSKQQIKTKAFIIHCGTYRHEILCVFGDKKRFLKEAAKWLNTSGMDFMRKQDFENNPGMFFDIPCSDVASKNKAWMIFIQGLPKTTKDYAVVQHEIFHAVYNILKYVGMRLSEDSEEAYAYLTEHLTIQMFTKLYNEK